MTQPQVSTSSFYTRESRHTCTERCTGMCCRESATNLAAVAALMLKVHCDHVFVHLPEPSNASLGSTGNGKFGTIFHLSTSIGHDTLRSPLTQTKVLSLLLVVSDGLCQIFSSLSHEGKLFVHHIHLMIQSL